MATSNSVDFTMTANDLVVEAFKLLGVLPSESTLESFELENGIKALNMMLKSWQAQGLHLWTKTEGVLFLDVGKTDYLLGPSGDEATELDDFIGSDTTAALVALDVAISITDTTGMVAGDKIGIALDSGVRHWSTISTVDSATQVTIATGVVSTAASGASVYTFTNLIDRPLRVLSARRKTYSVDSEIEISEWSRSQYFNQVNKESQGTIVNWYYSPQLTNGRIYVWQTASDVDQLLRFTYERPIEDVDDSTNNLDIPVEWLECITYNLAARMSNYYPASNQSQRQLVLIAAAQFLDDMLGWDEEVTSINLMPDYD
jgi:hypothetical protein